MLATVARPRKPPEKKKTKMIGVLADEQTHADFAKACELRGVTMSGIVHEFIVKVIREEKEREPDAFARTVQMPVKIIDEPEHLLRKHRRA